MAKVKKLFKDYTEEEVAKYRQQFVRSTLRRASYRWPWRNIATQVARIERGIYLCETCGSKVGNKEKQLDHKNPVVGPEGFTSWDLFIRNLFVSTSGWSVICSSCHLQKTGREGKKRRAKK